MEYAIRIPHEKVNKILMDAVISRLPLYDPRKHQVTFEWYDWGCMIIIGDDRISVKEETF